MGIHGFMGTFLPKEGREVKTDTSEMSAEQKANAIVQDAEMKRMYASVYEKTPNSVEVLYIDANSLCYDALEVIYAKGPYEKLNADDVRIQNFSTLHRKCYKLIYILICELITTVSPFDLVVVCFDGPVPVAKMWQQKQRRYESALNLDAFSTFDTNALTPGSTWMKGLMEFLEDSFERLTLHPSQYHVPQKIVLSSDLVSGEGEHKIVKKIRESKTNPKTVFYGMDSDIVLLCLTLVSERNIELYICNEFSSTQLKEYQEESKVEYLERKQRRESFISVNKLNDTIKKELHNRENCIKDFVFCCTLIGNDFLPRPFAMTNLEEGLKRIMLALDYHRTPIVTEDHISWVAFLKIIQYIVSDIGFEEGVMCGGSKYGLGNRSMENTGNWNLDQLDTKAGQTTFYREYTKFRSSWYTNALSPYLEVKHLNFSSDDIAEMCIYFLQGVSWTYQYYFLGMDSAPWDWVYPYSYSPFLYDVSLVLDGMLRNQFTSYLATGSKRKTNCLEQLVAVMPHLSLQWVPEVIRPLWDKKSLVADTMPQGILIDKDGVEANKFKRITETDFLGINYDEGPLYSPSKAWIGVKKLPPIEIDRIRNALNRESDGEYRAYLYGKEIEFKSSQDLLRGQSSRGRGQTTRGRGQSSRGRGTGSRRY